MNNSVKKIHVFGAIFTIFLGTVLHFLYEWTGHSKFTALFSPINESVWEHLKLLFFPIILFAVFEYFIYGKKTAGFMKAKAVSVFVAIFSVISIFYTYSGIIGNNILWIDILTFVISAVLAYLSSFYIIKNFPANTSSTGVGWFFALLILGILFGIFTFFTPHLGIFFDPKTNSYGILNH
ncbi:MAG: DUF6512 family protein [Bacillota bacterium]|nr:DUF6512 family protein [Bacillota bacterium]